MLRISLHFSLLLSSSLLISACAEDKGESSSDTGPTSDSDDEDGGDDGDTNSAPCPDEVPEEYRYLWDCSASTCDSGEVFAVHTGTGSSSEAGLLDTTEQWFLFWDRDTYCIEEFSLGGPTSAYDPASFNCSGCEEIYEVEWEMTTDNACGLSWGSVFVDDSDVDSPFSGFLMFDTHNAFGDRNEDNKMLVVSAPVTDGYYYPNADYGRGTANPSSKVDGPPTDYHWVSNGSCWGISRSTADTTPGISPPEAIPIPEDQ